MVTTSPIAATNQESPPDKAQVATSPDRGLTESDVEDRRRQGLGNRSKHETSRTYRQIIRDNLLTFINLTLIGIGVILIVMGQTKDAFLSSGLAVVNAIVGIIQESMSKRRLDRIALLTKSQATVVRDGQEHQIDPAEVVLGDILVVKAGDQIMLDGRIVGDGTMEVDESLLTGEADHIEKKPGDAVFSGSYCIAGAARYQAEKVGDETLASSIAAGAKAYRLAPTPLQKDVNLIVRVLLLVAGIYLAMILLGSAIWNYSFRDTVVSSAIVLGIVPSGLFLMITVTYSLAAVRLANRNALIQQMNAVESLSNVNIFCMDKTGTLTANKLNLVEVSPVDMDEATLRQHLGTFAASASGGTKTSEAIAASCEGAKVPLTDEVAFSSARKWSAVCADSNEWRGVYALGAPEMLEKHLGGQSVQPPDGWSDKGLRVLLFATCPTASKLNNGSGEPKLPADLKVAGWLGFTDELRPNSKQALDGFRDAGISVKIISGDNPETVAALAKQAGLPGDAKLVSGLELAEMSDAEFDEAAASGTVFGRITPEQKEKLVDSLKRRGGYVAMTGDGVNDVLSLKKANLGIAMQSGSQATRAAADIVLLGDSFGALPAAFREGRRIRRGLQGVLALFLTRVLVVALIINLTAVIAADFPFAPGHMTLLTLLTVGIPTFGLALWAHTGDPPASLMKSLFRFVFPAALLLSVVAFLTYILVFFSHDVDLDTLRSGSPGAAIDPASQISRDALTYLLVLAGLWLVIFAAPPTKWFAVVEESTGDWRPTILAGLMLALYAVILSIEGLRDFFGIHLMEAGDYVSIGAISLVWALALRTVWQKRLFERFIGLAPRAPESSLAKR